MGEGQIIAVIPARGGSKRIPRKNIRLFCGRPMIHWPIIAALESRLFSEIVVSTDDAEIAEVARAAGATPLLRPADLSDDMTALRPVLQHALLSYESQIGRPVAQLCSILATAALILPSDLTAGQTALAADGVDFVFAGSRFAAPVQRAFALDVHGGLHMMQPEYRLTRSQDLPECFYDAGQFYWGRRQAFMSDAAMYGPNSRLVLLPANRAIDIDTPDDWARAEAAFAALHQSNPS